MIDKKLLNILVCPVSKGELSYDEAKQELIPLENTCDAMGRIGMLKYVLKLSRHIKDTTDTEMMRREKCICMLHQGPQQHTTLLD